MSRNPAPSNEGFFARLINDIKEYFERCCGVNDIETRYARETEENNRKARLKASQSKTGQVAKR